MKCFLASEQEVDGVYRQLVISSKLSWYFKTGYSYSLF